VQRIGGDRALEISDCVVRAFQREQRVDASFDREDPRPIPTPSRLVGPRRTGELIKGGAAAKHERLVQQRQALGRIRDRSSLFDQVLEAVRVECARLDREGVARRAGQQVGMADEKLS
jgi:hypothetical protein